MTATTGSSEYLRNAVLTATPEQLQLMLYDGAIRFMLKARDAIGSQNREAAFHALDRAQAIVIELNNGLRREANPELADQMISLHLFVYRRLVTASIEQNAAALDEALTILRHQRETWALLIQKIHEAHSGPSETRGASPAATPPGTPRAEPRSASPSGFVADRRETVGGFVAEA